MNAGEQVLRSARIVVVDDTPANVLLLQAMLEADGYEAVEGFTDPVAALDSILKAPPDLVLLDIRMPFMDGHQVMARITSEIKEYLPIIVLTAQTDEETRIKALAGGAKDFLSKPFDQAEVLHRIRNTLETKLVYNERREHASLLEEVVSERTQELAHMASHDLITGLPNRASIRRDVARMEGKGKGLVMLVAIERLGNVSDVMGPAVGEMVLRSCAEELRDRMPKDSLMGYWGGSDFFVYVPGGDIDICVRKVLEYFSQPLVYDGVEVVLDARIGTCVYPDDGVEADRLVQRAGLAMITGRRHGVDHYPFSVALEEEAAKRHGIERELRRAVERNQLQLYYQPKLRLSDGVAIGMEALVRWIHPEMGFVSPGQFIPVAEETGAIVPVGEWVLKQAMIDCTAWRKKGYDIVVAVNVSGRQFSGIDLPGLVERFLGETGLDPIGLEVEITESALLHDLEQAKNVLDAIRELGISIALDDFGTGYSSLSYLRQLPLTTLKVDQSFVRYLDQNTDDQAMTRTIVKMAHGLGLKAVAEGIESEFHASFLRDIDCEIGQGYLFAKPMPSSAFTDWVNVKPTQKFAAS
ncbi:MULTISPECIES: putative bifunctional diguanylate cyclase/phosphodiesterase [unclassified Haematospirillum]|uniref:putative bifunctional diguanylate cyclase/phosphodiesterase n=1 Tax=unclassified Haematospirillum TaxID=2622088 RepID=UPI0014397CCC|nr:MULTISPECIES: EAL domain-containing protein [unclassified Haematospirillum]NKD54391.1 EAL domain-containing protein [Haematospirillum sp. H4890]NKD74434.1 EAL domain-containing protein [Haematospirillum sp. H4485]NKD86895.1 EAL domain-containing protein [Haematospirillum sp. 15-248]